MRGFTVAEASGQSMRPSSVPTNLRTYTAAPRKSHRSNWPLSNAHVVEEAYDILLHCYTLHFKGVKCLYNFKLFLKDHAIIIYSEQLHSAPNKNQPAPTKYIPDHNLSIRQDGEENIEDEPNEACSIHGKNQNCARIFG
jgi:hypothetical protein